ncbi:MAG: carboxypeptidase regulatory-like domain-containing protein [Thermoguttaceae bacterium]
MFQILVVKGGILSTRSISIVALCLPLVCFMPVIGCGQKYPDGFPKLYPISLTVTQEGKPLAGATVVLSSPESTLQWTIGGVTDERGVAPLWTHGQYKGAPVGRFKVTISKVVNEGEAEYIAALDREDTAAAAKIVVKSYSCVEPQYGDVATTPLEVTLSAKSRTVDVDAGKADKIEQKYLR